jgi:hypothetical protein
VFNLVKVLGHSTNGPIFFSELLMRIELTTFPITIGMLTPELQPNQRFQKSFRAVDEN